MKTKHTPGEWVAKAHPSLPGFDVCVPLGDYIATVAHSSAAEANAQLIAAAPDLLSELRFIVGQLEAMGFGTDVAVDGAELVDFINNNIAPLKAVIAKASGGAE